MCRLVNNRKDGTAFFNLMAIQPVAINRNRTILVGYQIAFKPTQTAGALAQTSTLIDRVQRQLWHGPQTDAGLINTHDTFRLDTVAMRFAAAFIRINDQLGQSANSRTLDDLSLGRRYTRSDRCGTIWLIQKTLKGLRHRPMVHSNSAPGVFL